MTHAHDFRRKTVFVCDCGESTIQRNAEIMIQRNAEIMRRYIEDGDTLHAIGESYGRTRERIRQIITKAGVASPYELRAARIKAKREAPRLCRVCGESYPSGKGREHYSAGAHLKLRYGTRIDSERWEGWAADYASGMKVADIMSKWNVNQTSIMRSVDAHGIPHRKVHNSLPTRAESDARKARILAATEAGDSAATSAERENCSPAWVRVVQRQARG